MKRNIRSFILGIILLPIIFILSACDNKPNNQSNIELTTEYVYALVQENGYTGTYEAFIQAIKGEKGDNGIGIAKIELTSSINGTDTYTITFSNNSTSTFSLKNGKDGNGIVLIAETNQYPDSIEYTITFTDGSTFVYYVKNGSGITDISKISTNGLVDTYKITYTNNESTTFNVTNGKDGIDGVGIKAIAKSSSDGLIDTYTITYTNDTTTTFTVTNGAKGEQGNTGATGNGIASITKTATAENVDTYTITFTNGSTTTFAITNGVDGKDGTNGQNGTDGVGIKVIAKTSTNGLVDTYTITYTDDTKTTFTVTNGKDGVDGQNGTDGKDGVGIKTATLNANNELVITLSNNEELNLGNVKGNKGDKGDKGETGKGIATIEKTNTSGLIDTYTITYTDNSTKTFTIVNGADGKGIDRIEKVSNGLTDTYTITYTDETTYEFTLNNGKDGVDGTNGKSAFEIYKLYFDYEGSEYDWILDLINGNLATVKYSVTFDSNGGSEIETQSNIKYGGKAIEPTKPTKQGYIFDGWYYGDTKWVFVGYSVTENMTLTAHWNPISYTVTFNTHGNGEYAIQTLTFDDDLVLPTPSFDGYTYTWQIDGEVVTNGKWNKTKDCEIELVKTPIVYTISYELNGGTNGDNPASYTIEDENIVLENPIKENYHFIGWYGKSDFSGEKITTILTSELKNISLYACFAINEYKISLNANGGNVENNEIVVCFGAGYTLPTPTKNGYNFVGWYNNTTKYENGVWSLEQDLALTADWEIITYTITYNLNDGTLETLNAESYTIETNTITLNNPSKTGYTFAGWFDNAEFNGTAITEIAKGTVGNKTLYAKYEVINYSITYNLDNGTNGNNPTTYNIETETITLVDANKTGYTFVGWFTESTFENKIEQIVKGTAENIELFAKFEAIEYSITYTLNDGTLAIENPNSYTIETNTTTLNNPTKTGYTFIGWFDNAEFNGTAITEIAKGTIENIELFAKFEIITYTITYNLNDGTNGNNPSSYTILTDTIILENPTKYDCEFLGWFNNSEFSGSAITYIDTANLTNIELFAKWQTTEYTLTTNANAGNAKFTLENESKVSTISYTMLAETNIPTLAIPQRNNYSFAGWYNESSCTTPFDMTTMPHENKTIYAKWIAYDITILYNTSKKAISINDTINATLFGATAIDTDGNEVSVVATNQNTQNSGDIITITLSANGLYNKSTSSQILNVKVYGLPTYTYNTEKDYINYTDILNSTLFSVVATDTFSGSPTIECSIVEEEYVDGDLITVRYTITDVAGNIVVKDIENVKYYGQPTITYSQIDIKATDTINSSLFSATAKDSFNEDVAVTTTLYSGTKQGGNTIIVKLYAIDKKGNEKIEYYETKVYGTPTINVTKTDFKVEDEITLISLGATAKDSFNEDLEMTLELVSGTQTAGSTMTYRITATDKLGNVASQDYELKIYGTPTITYNTSKLGVKVTDEINASLFSAIAKDSFDENLTVTTTISEGTQIAGTYIKVKFIATDKLGNEKVVETTQIGVYDISDLTISYSATESNFIAKSTKGSEFNPITSDSFGSPTETFIQVMSGTLSGGNSVTIKIGARDNAGNEVISNITTQSVRVYESSNIYWDITAREFKFIYLGEDLADFIYAQDEYEDWLDVNFEITSGEMISGSKITVKATTTDIAGNITTKSFENIEVLATSQTYVAIYYGDRETVESYKIINQNEDYSFGDNDSYCDFNDVMYVQDGNSVIQSTSNDVLKLYNLTDTFTFSETTLTGLTLKGKTLTKIVIPSYFTSIGNSAFSCCSSLTIITIPSSVTSIGYPAFYSCNSLVNVYYEGTIEDWCKISFGGTSSNPMYYASHFYIKDNNGDYQEVTEIVIPNTITEIKYYAFCGFRNVTNITIPSSVASIGYSAFSSSNSLVNVYYEGTIEDWCKISFVTDLSNPMYYASHFYIKDNNGEYQEVTETVIPNTITEIKSYAFYGFENVTSITIPNSVTSIGSYAFSGCSSLTSITIPNSVTSIRTGAFDDCDSLTSITFADTTTWYRTTSLIDLNTKRNGTQVDVTSTSKNATYFKATYYNYYWYKDN